MENIRKYNIALEEMCDENETDIVRPSFNYEDNITNNLIETNDRFTDIEHLSNDIDNVKDTAVVLESIKNSISNARLDQKNAKVVQTTITHLCNSIKYDKYKPVALESFGGTTTKEHGTEALALSIESIIDTAWEAIKAAFRKIVSIINSAIDWIVAKFKDLRNKFRKLYDEVRRRKGNSEKDKKETTARAYSNINNVLMAKGSSFANFFGYTNDDPASFTREFSKQITVIIDGYTQPLNDLTELLVTNSNEFVVRKNREIINSITEHDLNPINSIIRKIFETAKPLNEVTSITKKIILDNAKTHGYVDLHPLNVTAIVLPFNGAIFYCIMQPGLPVFKTYAYKHPNVSDLPGLPALEHNSIEEIINVCEKHVLDPDSEKMMSGLANELEKLNKTIDGCIKPFTYSVNNGPKRDIVQEIQMNLKSSMLMLGGLKKYQEQIAVHAYYYCLSSLEAREVDVTAAEPVDNFKAEPSPSLLLLN